MLSGRQFRFQKLKLNDTIEKAIETIKESAEKLAAIELNRRNTFNSVNWNIVVIELKQICQSILSTSYEKNFALR